jgi:transcriptional repressor NrdR
MVCIHCESKTQVINSRPQKRHNQVWRRRECLKCGAIFTTEESPLYNATWAVTSKKGVLQPFSRDKLFLSLYKSCQHRRTATSDAAGLTDTIIKKLASQSSGGLIDRHFIIQVAQVALNRFDDAASVHYRAFHV